MPEKDNKIQKILEKLRKLMDLKASATECGELGEANAAAAGITRLLREYDLTLQDIPDEQKTLDPVDVEVIPFRFSYMQQKWYWALMDVLAKYNNCQIVRTRQFLGNKVVDTVYQVVGREKHRQVVLYLISFCAHQFIRIGQNKYGQWKFEYIRSTGNTPPTLANYMKSFLYGCVCGLNDKLEEEQTELPQEKLNALVITSQNDINQFLQDMQVKKARSRAIQIDGSIMEEGQTVGRNISLHKGLKEQKNKTILLE